MTDRWHAVPKVADGVTRGPVSFALNEPGDTVVVPAPGPGLAIYVTALCATPDNASLLINGRTPAAVLHEPWEIAPNRPLVAYRADGGETVYLSVHFYVDRATAN